MRDGNWKMIVKEERIQLYNLANDIAEKTDVSAEHPDRAQAMRNAIRRWEEETQRGS